MLPIETVGWMGAKEIPVRGKHLDELSAVGDAKNRMFQPFACAVVASDVFDEYI